MVKRRAGSCFQLVLTAGLLTALAPSSTYAQDNYGIIENKDVMIPTRDGVKLAADIYRPARDGRAVDGKFPVILMRIPFDLGIDVPKVLPLGA